jgi:hypothetical protein
MMEPTDREINDLLDSLWAGYCQAQEKITATSTTDEVETYSASMRARVRSWIDSVIAREARERMPSKADLDRLAELHRRSTERLRGFLVRYRIAQGDEEFYFRVEVDPVDGKRTYRYYRIRALDIPVEIASGYFVLRDGDVEGDDSQWLAGTLDYRGRVEVDHV